MTPTERHEKLLACIRQALDALEEAGIRYLADTYPEGEPGTRMTEAEAEASAIATLGWCYAMILQNGHVQHYLQLHNLPLEEAKAAMASDMSTPQYAQLQQRYQEAKMLKRLGESGGASPAPAPEPPEPPS